MTRRLRVLLADDNDQLLSAIDELLRPEVDVVGLVKDGWAVMRSAGEHLPDVIVTDLDMPGLDGIQATRALSKLHPGIPVIILTVHRAPRLVHEAFDAGAFGYVLKTDAGDDLIDAVREAAKGRKFLSRSCRV